MQKPISHWPRACSSDLGGALPFRHQQPDLVTLDPAKQRFPLSCLAVCTGRALAGRSVVLVLELLPNDRLHDLEPLRREP